MLQKKTIAFHTLGCKLNFAETSSISHVLEREGFSKVKFEDGADVYVINTCSVTENADKECRSIIRRALRYSPAARIVVAGCYAQLKPDEIASIQGVDLVLGAKEKFRIADYLKILPPKKDFSAKGTVYSCDVSEVNFFESSYSYGERTRAFLKVQDGCDYNCTYCTIPLARGKSRSDSVTHVVEQANLLSELGVKEIVLTGVNIGDFGIHDPQKGKRDEKFLDLIQSLDAVEGIERFRISSIEPNLLTNGIIEFVAQSKRFMPHFHIPLQSGSDNILRLMKRRYLTKLYCDRIEAIKSLMPYCCIGADVIAGFPGETEKEFVESYNFLNKLDVSYLHVFTYSERDNTEAIHLGNAVPKELRHKRNKMLRILSAKKRHAFYEQHLGKVREVLFEVPGQNGIMEGFTDNYIKVNVSSNYNLAGKLIDATLKTITNDFVIAEVIPNYHPGYEETRNVSQSISTL